MDGNNEDAVLGLVLLNDKDNRPKEAMDQINLLIQKNPQRAEFYAVRAEMEVNRKAFESAEVDFKKAIDLDPENITYYINRAQYYIQTKQRSAARADLKKARSLGADAGELADLYQKIED